MKIPIMRRVLDENDTAAGELRSLFREYKLFVINIMGSPGAGKTSLIEQTLTRAGGMKIGVIEGDVASSIDADRVGRMGAPVVQINTGGGCHLNADMVKLAVQVISITDLDILVIENVGNLVCPVQFDLGENAAVIAASVPEGDDKPLKYPAAFSTASVVVLNKTDLMEHMRFDADRFEERVSALNEDAPLIKLSCSTGEGMDGWMEWLERGLRSARE